MSIEIRCDRCNRQFVQDGEHVNLLMYFPSTRLGAIEFSVGEWEPVKWEHEFHLCDECFDKVDKLIEGMV